MGRYETEQRRRNEELALLDHPSGLLPWEMAFCIEYSQHGNLVESLAVAKGVPMNETNPHSLRMQAVSLLKRPAVKQYIHKLQERLEEMGVMSMLEMQMFLSDAVRTPIESIDSNHPLCQKKITTVTTFKDGSYQEKTTLESVSKMDAAKTLIRMKGWDAPVKVDVAATGGVMLIPMTHDVETWENAAAESQAKLMEDAIDV